MPRPNVSLNLSCLGITALLMAGCGHLLACSQTEPVEPVVASMTEPAPAVYVDKQTVPSPDANAELRQMGPCRIPVVAEGESRVVANGNINGGPVVLACKLVQQTNSKVRMEFLWKDPERTQPSYQVYCSDASDERVVAFWLSGVQGTGDIVPQRPWSLSPNVSIDFKSGGIELTRDSFGDPENLHSLVVHITAHEMDIEKHRVAGCISGEWTNTTQLPWGGAVDVGFDLTYTLPSMKELN